MSQEDTGRLLRRLIWKPIDFEDEHSVDQGRALDICQQQLLSGSREEARQLWTELQRIADEVRRSGGQCTLKKLVDELRGTFDLRDFPDYEQDWALVTEDSRSALGRIPSTIGGKVELLRTREHKSLDQALSEHRLVALIGASGTGKTAIAKRRAERALTADKVFWLDASRIQSCTLAGWKARLGLTHSLNDLLGTALLGEGVLVVDSLDRLVEPADFATVAQFFRAVRLDEEIAPWKVLITCTPEEWARVGAELASHGVVSEVKAVTVDVPSSPELQKVADAFPGMRGLLSRQDLTSVLLRPKVLDLVASSAATTPDLSEFGESDLVRWFWKRHVGSGTSAALRAKTAQEIARHLADTLQPDLPLSGGDAVPNTTGVDLLLQDPRILRQLDGRVAFEHDLYGDWIRAQLLVDRHRAGELSHFLASRLNSPIWHRAFRLLGIHLLEQEDPESWKGAYELVGQISAPAGRLAQDLLLEAIAFSSTAREAAEWLWSFLTEGYGNRLNRLLERFFYSATIPEPAFSQLSALAPELEIHLTATARRPYLPYWGPLLSLLHAHRQEIPPTTWAHVARVADLWLRFTGPEAEFRQEAAGLAVALGEGLLRTTQQRSHLFLAGEVGEQVYKAVLAAVGEETEEVLQILLEAAGRRDQRFAPPPLSDEELAKRMARGPAGVRRLASYGPVSAPWPRGPRFRVDQDLQKVVLETHDALLPLIKARPNVARELLLALLIKPPQRRSYSLNEADCGLVEPNWSPPFYSRGPLRSFLASAEAEAIACIVQLIDFVTDRWAEAEAATPGRGTPSSVPVQVEGEERRFLGHGGVFGWSYQGPGFGGTVESVLMALEKHLYDQEDAGVDVDPLLQRLLSGSRSAAMLGVLSLFGRRHPKYLRGPLRGLLVSPELLRWTLMDTLPKGWKIPLSLGTVPAHVQPLYREWHEMPHREKALLQFAIWFYFNDPEIRSFIEEAKQSWKEGLRPGGECESDAEWIQNLLAQLDPANYSEHSDESGATQHRYTRPEHLRDEEPAGLGDLVELSAKMVPAQCLDILRSDQLLTPESRESLWATIQLLQTLTKKDESALLSHEDALTAVAAVLIKRGRDTPGMRPEQSTWARQVILDTVADIGDDATSGIPNPWSGLSFAASALPSLWAETPQDPDIRKAVARVVLRFSPDKVSVCAAVTSEHRERLTEDHRRLIRAVLLRAGLEKQLWRARRVELGYESQEGDQESVTDLEAKLDEIERALAEGILSTNVPAIDEIAPIEEAREQVYDPGARGRATPPRCVDESLLRAAFEGVPDPLGGDDEWLSIWTRTARELVPPLGQADDEPTQDLEEYPSEWDRYLMERVAGAVTAVKDVKAAKGLWQPILNLGASAPQWVSRFARRWIRYALAPGAEPWVVESWLAMIEAALEQPRWTVGDGYTASAHHSGEIWRSLLGWTPDYLAAEVWVEELRPRVDKLKPYLTRWAKDHLANPGNVEAFAAWLKLPAADALVLDGLIWLHNAPDWSRDSRTMSIDTAVNNLLVYAWTRKQSLIRQRRAAFDAFLALLQRLVVHQYPVALELATRVGAPSSG